MYIGTMKWTYHTLLTYILVIQTCCRKHKFNGLTGSGWRSALCLSPALQTQLPSASIDIIPEKFLTEITTAPLKKTNTITYSNKKKLQLCLLSKEKEMERKKNHILKWFLVLGKKNEKLISTQPNIASSSVEHRLLYHVTSSEGDRFKTSISLLFLHFLINQTHEIEIPHRIQVLKNRNLPFCDKYHINILSWTSIGIWNSKPCIGLSIIKLFNSTQQMKKERIRKSSSHTILFFFW